MQLKKVYYSLNIYATGISYETRCGFNVFRVLSFLSFQHLLFYYCKYSATKNFNDTHIVIIDGLLLSMKIRKQYLTKKKRNFNKGEEFLGINHKVRFSYLKMK